MLSGFRNLSGIQSLSGKGCLSGLSGNEVYRDFAHLTAYREMKTYRDALEGLSGKSSLSGFWHIIADPIWAIGKLKPIGAYRETGSYREM